MNKNTSLLISFLLSFTNMIAQTTGDYRSRQTGAWTTATSWQTFDGTNWINAASAPSSSNGIITILSGHVITSNAALTADQVMINSGGTLSVTGGTFTLAASTATDLDCNGTLNLSGGTLNGGGNINVNASGTFNWTGGINGGGGTMNINSGAALTMSGSNHSLGDTKTLNNYGIWTWTGGNFLYNNGAPVVNNYAVLNINTDADVNQNGANTGTFNNTASGIINKTGSATDETSFNNFSSFINAGTININSGRLRFTVKSVHTGTVNIASTANLNFSSGVALFNAGTTLAGAGSLNFESGNDTLYAGSFGVSNINVSGGTVSISPTITMGDGGAFGLSGGTLTGPGTINFNSGSSFNWTGGTNAGSGITNINDGAVFVMNGGNLYLADTRTINNYGTWTWGGGTFYYNNGSPVVNNYSTFNINTDADVVRNNTNTGLFTNAATGVINKIGSPSDETSFSNFSSFANAGTINIASGRIRLNVNSVNSGTVSAGFGGNINYSAGTAAFNGGTVITGAGYLNFDGANAVINSGSVSVNNITVSAATVTVAPDITVYEDGTFTFSGGTLNGASNYTFLSGSSFTWSGGVYGGSGITTLNAGAAFIMSGGNMYFADTRTLNNYGTWNWTSGNFYYNNGSPVANNYGIFNISSDGDVVQNNANTGSFTNKSTGVINKTGSTSNETSFNSIGAFNNHGGVNVISGNLALNVNGAHTGAYAVSSGAQLRGSIAMSFSGSPFANDGSVTLTGLTFNGSATQTLNGTGSINTLTVNNANGIRLGGTQTVNAALALTSGKITLGNNNLIMGPSAAITGGTAASYVVTNGLGSLQRRVPNNNTNVVFPVGTAAGYLPTGIQLTTASTADNFRVRVLPNLYGNYDTTNANPVGDAIAANSVNATWFMTENVTGGSNATLTLQWNGSDEAPGFNRALGRLGQYTTAGGWNLDAAKAASGTNPYTLSRTGVSSFFAFGITNQFVTTNANLSVVCAGNALTIPYTLTGAFNAGNVFTAQLSDAAGSFASPLIIGSANSTVSGSITALIPAATAPATTYKVRIVSSSPSFTGPANVGYLAVQACPGTPPVLIKKCGKPTDLGIFNVAANGIQASWNDVGAATGGYEVQYKKTADAVWSSVNVSYALAYIGGLQANTSYDVRVRAKCGAQVSDFSDVLTFTTTQFRISSGFVTSTSDKILLYPNPNSGRFVLQLHFKAPGAEPATIQILNTAGQIVYTEKVSVSGYDLRRTISFSSSGADGMYLVTVVKGSEVYYGKMNYQKGWH